MKIDALGWLLLALSLLLILFTLLYGVRHGDSWPILIGLALLVSVIVRVRRR